MRNLQLDRHEELEPATGPARHKDVLYRAVSGNLSWRARRLLERVMFFRDRDTTFFDVQNYSWVAPIEANWLVIRKELDALLTHLRDIPNFQDLSEKNRILTEGEQWKTFFLYEYGVKAPENCLLCPNTVQLLQQIPGVKTAMFSILAPRKHIPEHRGIYKGMLRYHLGLIVPGPDGSCRIRVGQDIRPWREGKSLIFDDTHPHEVWNDTDYYRVVLFVDVARPLFFPLSLLNHFIIWVISRTPSITETIERARKAPAPGQSASGTSNKVQMGAQ